MMGKYSLYGTELIKKDDTLKDFATCVYESCPLEAIMEDGEERKDFILNAVYEALQDDISRTDIHYEELLYQYRSDIGDVLYEICNQGIPLPEIEFFGEKAKAFFNELVYRYIDIHYEAFANGTMN